MLWDLRQAARTLLKSPGFSALVVAVLAVGIGATTAIFSVVYGVVLKPLPFADPARLVALQTTVRGEADDVAYLDLKDWAAQSKTIDRMAGYTLNGSTLTGAGEPEALQIAGVSGDFFQMLGVPPLRGRWLRAADDGAGIARTVVISEALWERHFHRDERAIGRLATFDDQPATIVGVMPARFQFPFDPEPIQAWMPMHAMGGLMAHLADQRAASFLSAIGHLRPGVTRTQANAELTTVAARLAAQYPDTNQQRGARATPLQRIIVKDYRLGLFVLLGAVGVVLLIASVNVANLLLARATVRRRELAIRAALGAGRARLVRQLLTEATLLALAGGAGGLLLAAWIERALLAATPIDLPRLHDVGLDGPVLTFAMLCCLSTAFVFGLVPALHTTRTDMGEALKEDGRGGAGGGSGARTRQALVVAEVALSLVLLTSAGLLVRSLVRLLDVDPGFVAERAATFQLLLPEARYPKAASQIGFYRRLIERLDALPGAAASGISTTIPMSGSNISVGLRFPDRPDDPAHRESAPYFAVSPGYFGAMGIPLVRGRLFTARDDESAPNVAIVGEALARRYWPGEDPIGKHLTIRYNNLGPREVVGVVRDVKRSGLDEPITGAVYAPFPQTPWPFLSAVVRAAGDPAVVATALRAVPQSIDPGLAPPQVKRLAAFVSQSTARPRFTTALVGSFAGLAVVLAGLGLYGVLAYTVGHRRREIGIRIALGAQRADVRRLVVGQALRMGATGLAIGLAGAFAATRLLGSLLFGVSASDPLTFAAVCALLAGVVVAAASLPARRAMSVDPMAALKAD